MPNVMVRETTCFDISDSCHLKLFHILQKMEGSKSIFEDIASRIEDKNILFIFLSNNVQHQLNVRKLSFLNWYGYNIC